MAVSIHGNNGVTTTNGTAAAPSFAAPDNDTGLYFGTNLIHASTDGTERLRIQADGNVAIGTNAVSSGDLATGTTIGLPKLHVDCGHLGNGAYHIARFRAGSDNDNNAAVLTLNHSNDRGLALYGGRSSGDRSWIAIKSIDSGGRVSNAIEIIGDEGQGVQDLKFYTGDSTTTTQRLHIKADGKIEVPTTGKLSLGMSSPAAQFTAGTANGSRVIEIQGIDGVIRGYNRNSSAWAAIDFEASSYSFDTAGTLRMTLTEDGPHLLLGGTSDINEITESSANAGMVIGGTGFGNAGLAIINSTTGCGRIYFGDNVGNHADRNRGQINYYHNGDYMLFATAGSERLKIYNTNSGNGGIAKFTTPLSGDMLNLQNSSASGQGLIFGVDTSASPGYTYWKNNTTASYDAAFIVGGSERLRILSDGHVRIQHNTTNAKLLLSRNVSVGTDDTPIGVVDFANNTAHTVNARIMAKTSGTGNVGGQLVIETRDPSNSTLTEKIRITAAGKIGIGHHSESQITNGKELSIRPANDGGIRLIRPGDTISSPNIHLDITTTTAGSAFPSGEAYTAKYKTMNCDQIFETYAGGGTGGNISFRTSTSNNSSESVRITKYGQLLQGHYSTDQGFATFWRYGSSGGDAGTAGDDGAGDKGVNIRADMGPTHTDLTGVDNYTLALRNKAYGGSGIADPQGTITKILFNGGTYNGWNSYGAIALDTQGVSGGRGDLVFSTASGTSIMSSRLRIKATEIDTENNVGLNVYGEAINHTNDAVLYCRKTNNADWAFSAHAAHGSGTDYGIYTRVQSGANYAIGVYDHANSSWKLRINGAGAIYATNTTVQSISDQRLKENIVDANSQWNDIKALRFRNFKWTADSGYADGKTYLGLIAQEVEPISPNLVEINAQTKEDIENEVTDPEYKNVKYSIVWMKAVKALQEAQARIETLESKVAALEGS